MQICVTNKKMEKSRGTTGQQKPRKTVDFIGPKLNEWFVVNFFFFLSFSYFFLFLVNLFEWPNSS